MNVSEREKKIFLNLTELLESHVRSGRKLPPPTHRLQISRERRETHRNRTMAIPESVTLAFYVAAWYIGNTFYNIVSLPYPFCQNFLIPPHVLTPRHTQYNKKALNQIHAHWTVAFAQLVVSVSCLPGSAPKLSSDHLDFFGGSFHVMLF